MEKQEIYFHGKNISVKSTLYYLPLWKRYFHEIFCQKSVRVNFRNFHTVYWQNFLPILWSTGILEDILKTTVNFPIENGLGAIGNLGSKDNFSSWSAPPTKQTPSGPNLISSWKWRVNNSLRAGSCENWISDSIPILILGNHRFQNFWKGTHVKIESE